MGFAAQSAEMLLRMAMSALDGPLEQLIPTLDALPAAIVVTDRRGAITHFNRAFLDFVGTVPDLGRPGWYKGWNLYTVEGQPIPEERTPTAIALREQRSVRGVESIAERPDGLRIRFRSHPTPIFDPSGEMLGAINLLVETEPRQWMHEDDAAPAARYAARR